jgi:HK97 gp10 family phage protein
MSDRNVKGLAQLQAAMDSLPAKIEANIMRGAMRAGAQVIATEAKQTVSRISGDLAASIKASARLDRRRAKVVAYVRAGGNKSAAWYARMVEMGTKPHFISIRTEDKPTRMTRRGRRAYSIRTINKMVNSGSLKIGGKLVGANVFHPGARPKPFLRPAMDNKAQAAVEAVREYIRRRLASKHGINVPGPDDRDDA